MPSAAAITRTRLTHAWKALLKVLFEASHSPGVARATGTVTTKPNEMKTNIATKAVIINIFETFYIDDLIYDSIKDYLFLKLIIQLQLGRLA